jgi:hypothetical protein
VKARLTDLRTEERTGGHTEYVNIDTDGQTGRWTDGHADKWTDRHSICRQMHRQTQADMQTNGQMNRRTD